MSFYDIQFKHLLFYFWQNCSDSSNDMDEGEDQEASSLHEGKNIEDALISFREQWQRELTISPKRDEPKAYSLKQPSNEIANDETSIENRVQQMSTIRKQFQFLLML